ncbi:MAG TPA: TolC family protein, partial [Noviherbaspirillum sp.]|nr:TolC family protein [Noviherbaspirillum sp.]
AHADLLLARGETIAVQTELSAAEQALLEVRQDYLQLVGDDRLPADAVETAPGVQAIDTHPRLLASARRVEAARARAQLTARTGRENPELALLARRERGDADERYGNAFGVAIRIPLGTAARNAPRMAVAQAELTEAETEHARLREALEQAQRKAQAEMDSARTRAELAEARLVLARENQALAKKAFSLGEKSLFEFQRVQSALDESALAAGQAAIEQHRAQARLNQASGVLP